MGTEEVVMQRRAGEPYNDMGRIPRHLASLEEAQEVVQHEELPETSWI